ncbi:hypothetical protein JT358_03190 [Micrococcales bacterium 31B]|nr:hypothetical protein [Micrococcales bacterium 31B]
MRRAQAAPGASSAPQEDAPPPIHKYVKLPFSERVYMTTQYPNDIVAFIQWISFADWAKAGYPNPEVVNTMPGGRFVQNPWSGEVMMWGFEEEYPLRLTHEQWVSMGSPNATTSTIVWVKAKGNAVYTYESPDDGPMEKYGYAKLDSWQRMGSPTPKVIDSFGSILYKAPNSEEIYMRTSGNPTCGIAHHVTLAEWLEMGAPTPTATVDPRTLPCQ